MIRPLTMLLLVAPLLLSAQVSAETIEKEDMAQEFAMMLRGGGEAYDFGSNGYGYGDGNEYGGEMQHGRRLAWDWSCSWGNLLFHLGMCHPPPPGDYQKCPAPSSSSSSSSSSHLHPHPHIMPRCDCPNCDAPGSYKFDFCTSSNSDSSSSSSSGSGSSSSSSTQNSNSGSYQAQSSDNGNTYAYVGDDSEESSQQNRSKQSATSMFFNPMAYVVVGSAAVLLVGAALLRKRQSEAEENAEKKAGAVSKRRGLIASGDDVLDITSPASSQPQFIEMQTLERSPTTISQVGEGEGIELEGPLRPSSYYAMT